MAKKKRKYSKSIADALLNCPAVAGDYEIEIIGLFEGKSTTLFSFDKVINSKPADAARYAIRAIAQKLSILTHKDITMHYSFEYIDEVTGEIKIGEDYVIYESRFKPKR